MFIAGLAGGLYAYWQSYIAPPVAFDMDISVKGFVIMLLGGPGSVFGPVVAAFALQLVSTLAWGYLLNWHLGLMGILIMVAVLLPSERNVWTELLSPARRIILRIPVPGHGRP